MICFKDLFLQAVIPTLPVNLKNYYPHRFSLGMLQPTGIWCLHKTVNFSCPSATVQQWGSPDLWTCQVVIQPKFIPFSLKSSTSKFSNAFCFHETPPMASKTRILHTPRRKQKNATPLGKHPHLKQQYNCETRQWDFLVLLQSATNYLYIPKEVSVWGETLKFI